MKFAESPRVPKRESAKMVEPRIERSSQMKTRKNDMENQFMRGQYSRQEGKFPISPSLIRVHACNPRLRTLKNRPPLPSVGTLGISLPCPVDGTGFRKGNAPPRRAGWGAGKRKSQMRSLAAAEQGQTGGTEQRGCGGLMDVSVVEVQSWDVKQRVGGGAHQWPADLTGVARVHGIGRRPSKKAYPLRLSSMTSIMKERMRFSSSRGVISPTLLISKRPSKKAAFFSIRIAGAPLVRVAR
jgi:hypothetical protein